MQNHVDWKKPINDWMRSIQGLLSHTVLEHSQVFKLSEKSTRYFKVCAKQQKNSIEGQSKYLLSRAVTHSVTINPRTQRSGHIEDICGSVDLNQD